MGNYQVKSISGIRIVLSSGLVVVISMIVVFVFYGPLYFEVRKIGRVHQETFPNGKPSYRDEYGFNWWDGRWHQKEIYWQPKGSKTFEYEIADGQVVEIHRWDLEGRLLDERSGGRVFRDSQPFTGDFSYDLRPCAFPRQTVRYQMGWKVLRTLGDANGQRIEQEEYEKGLTKRVRTWYSNGKKREDHSFELINGVNRTIKSTWWSQDGKMQKGMPWKIAESSSLSRGRS